MNNTPPFPLNFHLEMREREQLTFALQAQDPDGDAVFATLTALPEAEVGGRIVDNRGSLRQVCECPASAPEERCDCGRRIEAVPVPVASPRMLLTYAPDKGPEEYGRPYAKFKFTVRDFAAAGAGTGQVQININSPPTVGAPHRVDVAQGGEVEIVFRGSDVDVEARAQYPVSALVPSTLPYPLAIQGAYTNELSAVVRGVSPSLEPNEWDGLRLGSRHSYERLRMAPGAVGAHVEDMRLLYSPPLALRALGVDSVRIAYAVNDSMVLSRDDSSVTVHINWEPEGANSSYVTIDTTALIVPLAGTDPNGDTVDAAIVDLPDRGSLYISYGEDRVGDDVASYMASGGVHIPVPPGADVAAVRYVPPQLGADDPDEITTSFAYAVYDGQLTGSKLGHVTVRVKRRNRPPHIPLDARDVSVHTLEDRSFILELSGIDPDDGDVVAARIASLPELGALHECAVPRGAAARRVLDLLASNETVPASLFVGQRIDSIGALVSPGRALGEDTVAELDARGAHTELTHSRVRVVFVPKPATHSGYNEEGVPYGRFSYVVTDGVETSTEAATVSVHVDGRPVSPPDVVLTTLEDTEILYNCTGEDPEGEIVTPIVYSTAGQYRDHGGRVAFEPRLFEVAAGGARVPITPDILPHRLTHESGTVVFVPAEDAHSSVFSEDATLGGAPRLGAFTYRVSDGKLVSATSTTVSFQVMPVNDPPTAAKSFSAETHEGTPVEIALPASDIDVACEVFNVSIPEYKDVEITNNETNITAVETVLVNVAKVETRECAQQPAYAILVSEPQSGTGRLSYEQARVVLDAETARSAWASVGAEGLRPGEITMDALEWNLGHRGGKPTPSATGALSPEDGVAPAPARVTAEEAMDAYEAAHAHVPLRAPPWLADAIRALDNVTLSTRWLFPVLRLDSKVVFHPPPCSDYFSRTCPLGKGFARFSYAAVDGEGAVSDALTTVTVDIKPKLDASFSRFERFPTFVHTVKQGDILSFDEPPEEVEDPTGMTTRSVAEWQSPKRPDLMHGLLYSWGRNDDAHQLGLGAGAADASANAARARADADAAAVDAAAAAKSAGAKDAAVAAAAAVARAAALAERSERLASSLDAAARDVPALSLAAEAAGIDFESVAAADGHAFGIDTRGRLYSWGLDKNGRLGQPPPPMQVLHSEFGATSLHPSAHPPTQRPGATYASSYAPAGGRAEAGVYDSYGGPADTDRRADDSGSSSSGPRRSCDVRGCVYFAPTLVSALRGVRVTRVYACTTHAMALSDTGEVYQWGDNTHGQLGRGEHGEGSAAANDEDSLLLGGPRERAYALAAERRESTGPHDAEGNTGPVDAGAPPAWLPVRVAALEGKRVVEGGVGAAHSAALTSDGALYTWGSNAEGQLGLLDCAEYYSTGDGTCQTHAATRPRSAHTPQLVDAFRVFDANGRTRGQALARGYVTRALRVRSIGVGWHYTLAIGTDGQVYSWGYGETGQLGHARRQHHQSPDSHTVGVPTPIAVLEDERIHSVHGGRFHSGALAEDGRVFMWGSNVFGQLGVGDTAARFEPTVVGSLVGEHGVHVNLTTISLGTYHTVALADKGHVLAWGSNAMGQTGTSALFEYRRTGVDAESGNVAAYIERSDMPLHHAWDNGMGSFGVLPESLAIHEDTLMGVNSTVTGLRLVRGSEPTRPEFARVGAGFASWPTPRVVVGLMQARSLSAGGLFTLAVRSACPRGTVLNATSGGCKRCPYGHVANGLNALGCRVCPAGTFRATDGANACVPCAPGTYSPKPGASGCLACKAGTFNSFSGSSSQEQCMRCPAGSFASEESAAECELCPAGSYQPHAGESSCVPCPQGTYSAAVGGKSADECIDCPVGSHGLAARAAACSLCPPGTRNPSPGGDSLACEPCREGTYSDTHGARQCTKCPRGTFANTTHASTVEQCAPCPEGTYGPAEGAVACVPCPVATFADVPGLVQCERCDAGTRGREDAEMEQAAAQAIAARMEAAGASALAGDGPTEGQPPAQVRARSAEEEELFAAMTTRATRDGACVPCDIGTHSVTSGALECIECAEGTFSGRRGATECEACPAGTFLDVAGSWKPTGVDMSGQPTYPPKMGSSGAHPCFDCPAGSFAHAAGMGHCLECPPGTFADLTGSTECVPCDAGFFQPFTGALNSSYCQPCEPGTHAASSGTGTCMPCPPGHYADLYGSTECVPCGAGSALPTFGANATDMCSLCPLGTFAPSSGAATCTRCPPGSFADGEGSTECTPCPRGTANPYEGSNSSDACVDCGVGTIAAEVGTSECYNCTFGSYQENPGRSECVPCPAGKFLDFTGSFSREDCTECDVSVAGTHAERSGSRECDLCPPGTYADEPGMALCKTTRKGTYIPFSGSNSSEDAIPCGIGTFADARGASECEPCNAGGYAPDEGSEKCNGCPPGTFLPYLGAVDVSECQKCRAGMYAPDRGSASCKLCPPGEYGPTAGMAKCLRCPAGFFQDEAGSTTKTSCKRCPKGTFSDREGANRCQVCEVGRFSNETGSTSCYSCAPGTYLDVIGMASQDDCKACEPGFHAPYYGMDACEQCPQGTYNGIKGQSECAKCPAGTYGQVLAATEADACDDCPRWRFTSDQGSTGIHDCYYVHQAAPRLRAARGSALATAALAAAALLWHL